MSKNFKINYGTSFPCQFTKEGKNEIERMASTCERIQTHLRAIEKQYYKRHGDKFQKPLRKDHDHSYYLGKLMAYTFVLNKLGTRSDYERAQRVMIERGFYTVSPSEAMEFLPYLSRKRKKAYEQRLGHSYKPAALLEACMRLYDLDVAARKQDV